MDKKLVTILLPAYNEEASFPIIERCMNQVLEENPNYNWEFLFINDGSKDNTLQQMIKFHQRDSHYSYIDLSRNYGKEVAMMAWHTEALPETQPRMNLPEYVKEKHFMRKHGPNAYYGQKK